MGLQLVGIQSVNNRTRSTSQKVESHFEYQYDDGAKRLICTIWDQDKDGRQVAVRTMTHPQPVYTVQDAENLAIRISVAVATGKGL